MSYPDKYHRSTVTTGTWLQRAVVLHLCSGQSRAVSLHRKKNSRDALMDTLENGSELIGPSLTPLPNRTSYNLDSRHRFRFRIRAA